jgi:phosphoserine phosphatase
VSRAFANDNLIAIRPERDAAGTITGRMDGVPSCREGKVARVESWLTERGRRWPDFQRTTACSDSPDNLPLPERANDPAAARSPALAAISKERGWRIQNLFT